MELWGGGNTSREHSIVIMSASERTENIRRETISLDLVKGRLLVSSKSPFSAVMGQEARMQVVDVKKFNCEERRRKCNWGEMDWGVMLLPAFLCLSVSLSLSLSMVRVESAD